MIYRATLITAILMVFAVSLLAHQQIERPMHLKAMPRWKCDRIVSMAPSITETLYALGLGDRVVGVTRNSTYPPEAKDKARVGSYFDPNFEAILALKPDLVIMLEEQEKSSPGFAKLELETLVVSNQTLQGIIESFRVIGRVCGKGPEGRRMAASYENRLRQIREKTRDLPRPSVLFAVDRTFGCGHLADVYVAADDDYLDEMVELAGGRNACRQRGIRYPIVSSEGLLWLNPDVIVDLVPSITLDEYGRSAILDDWNDLWRLSAVEHHRVLIFSQDYAFIPGPRFIRLVEDLARAIHPEVFWDRSEGLDFNIAP